VWSAAVWDKTVNMSAFDPKRASDEGESYHQGTASMSTAAALERDDAFTPSCLATERTVAEPSRKTPVHAETHVRGGPAGCAAALAARRVGAEVVLVERYNHLGGLSTGGLVIWIDRMTDWSGRPVNTTEDWKHGICHHDEIGVSPSPSQKFENVSVPFRALVADDLDNLLAPGRHMACDPQTQAFMREIPQCWLTGQAAGVAAAHAVTSGVAASDADIAAVRRELRRQGVYLQAGDDSTGAIAGGPPRGPKVSITADTPLL
jgi:FAD dependent oxidoreductase